MVSSLSGVSGNGGVESLVSALMLRAADFWGFLPEEQKT
jgi:hypothetical protein